jgi:hypothetical protein
MSSKPDYVIYVVFASVTRVSLGFPTDKFVVFADDSDHVLKMKSIGEGYTFQTSSYISDVCMSKVTCSYEAFKKFANEIFFQTHFRRSIHQIHMRLLNIASREILSKVTFKDKEESFAYFST